MIAKKPPKHSLLAVSLDQKCLRIDLVSEEKRKESDMPVSGVCGIPCMFHLYLIFSLVTTERQITWV